MEKPALNDMQLFAKRLVRLAVHKLGGNVAASDWTGFSGSELSLFASDDSERQIHLWRAMSLDEGAQDAILKAWARRRGYELVSSEQRSELAHNVSKIVGRLAHAGADLQSTALDAVSDGKATNNEIRDTEARASALIGAAEDTLRAVASLRAV